MFPMNLLHQKLCKKYKYTVLDKTTKSFVFEVSALKKEIDELIKKLQPLGLASASRTGVVAMTKGAAVSYTHLRAHETDSYIV